MMQTEVLDGIAEDVEREALQRQQAVEKKQVCTKGRAISCGRQARS